MDLHVKCSNGLSGLSTAQMKGVSTVHTFTCRDDRSITSVTSTASTSVLKYESGPYLFVCLTKGKNIAKDLRGHLMWNKNCTAVIYQLVIYFI